MLVSVTEDTPDVEPAAEDPEAEPTAEDPEVTTAEDDPDVNVTIEDPVAAPEPVDETTVTVVKVSDVTVDSGP